MFRIGSLFMMIALATSQLCAQTNYQSIDASSRIDSVLASTLKETKPGGIIAILYKGELVFTKSYGVENLNNLTKIDAHSQFYIASVGKTFTSAAILYLWEQQLLNLDDVVSKYVPDAAILKKVTIRQLLTHTSGIPDYYDHFGEDIKGLSNSDVLEFIKTAELEFIPGSTYAYSNSAYILLSFMIENITGNSYSTFLQETFFNPLNLSNTVVYDSKDVAIQNKVMGYNTDNTLNDYENFTYGSGGIYSSITDLISWYKAIYNNRLLKKPTWNLAFTPPQIPGKRTYLAMGWNYEDCPSFDKDVFSVSSFGVLNGFRAALFMVPELDFSVITLSNNGEELLSPYDVLNWSFTKN